MKFFHLILLTIFVCVCCEKKKDEDVTRKYEEEEDVREGKRFLDSIEEEKWHSVSSHKWKGADDWVPHDNYSPPTMVRIRKRKRRPQPVKSEESEEYSTTIRKIKPETLNEFSNSWGDMENESPGRPYHRRRVSPIYNPDVENDHVNIKPLSAVLHVGAENPQERISEATKPIRVYEKVRDPFTALQEAEEKARLKKKAQENERREEMMTTVSDLKALLKQSGGSISLSEILQQKNLSLQDLLKGKEHAISALTEKPEEVVEIFEYKNPVEESTEPLLKWKILENGFYTKSYSSSSASSSEEIEVSSEAPKKTFVYNKSSSRPNPSLKKYEVINEPTTERRIFVPSHPKYYTSLNYKPNKTEESTEKPQVTRTSSVLTTRKANSDKYLDFRSKFVSLKPKLKNSFPVTSAKISFGYKLLPNTSSTTAIPISAFTINLKDVFGISQIVNKTFKATTKKPEEDGPMKMNIDIDTVVDKKPLNSNEVDSPFNTSTNSSGSEKKNKPSSAREEILEFLQDSKSRAHLTRILKLRNMTVEELVAQRERGSSQLHLADIFHNRTREPEPPNEPLVGHVRNFFERKPKTISQPDDKKEGFKLKIQEGDGKKKKELRVTNFPTYKFESQKDEDESQSSPSEVLIWKSLFPTPNPNKEGGLDNEVKRIEEIENSISDAINNELNIELHEDEDDEQSFFKFPIGVKSAIIASAAIVGISCLVFFTIFIIFKWSQKQKRKLCYSDSFSCSRIKSPILETRPRRTIKTMVSETLGRKRKYSNVYPQSMSDYMWENDKKTPFQ